MTDSNSREILNQAAQTPGVLSPRDKERLGEMGLGERVKKAVHRAGEWAGKIKDKVDEKVIGFQLKHGIALGIGDTVGFGSDEGTKKGRVRMRAGSTFYTEFVITGRRREDINGEEKAVIIFDDELADGTAVDIPLLDTLLSAELHHIVLAGRSLTSEIENAKIYGLVATAEEIAKGIGSVENRQEAHRQVQQMKEKYLAHVAMVEWWHLAAGGERGVYAHNFSMGKETFDNGITKGAAASRWVPWLAQSEEHGASFIKGLATPRESLKFEEFKDPYECMGAMLRISSGVSTKDQLDSEGKPIDPNTTKKIYVHGQRAKILKKDGTTTDRVGTTNAAEYELHKQLTLLEYAQKYEESRMEMLDTVAFELVGYEEDLETHEQIPVYKCHLDKDWLQAYDMFQNPTTMPAFWYSNLENLPEPLVLQLGGRHFDDDQDINLSLNKLYLGKIKDLLAAPEDDRRLLFEKLGVDWNEDWSLSQKYDVLEGLGMIRRKNGPAEEIYRLIREDNDEGETVEEIERNRREPGRIVENRRRRLGRIDELTTQVLEGTYNPWARDPWGYDEHYLLTTRLIGFKTHEIDLETWQKLDWKALASTPKRNNNFMGHWAMQMYYLLNTRRNIIELLLGKDIMEKASDFLRSKEAYQHIPDILSPEAHKERTSWITALSPLIMLSLYDSRMKGLRDKEVGAQLNKLTQMGLYDGMYMKEWRNATGKDGLSYGNIIERGGVETFESVAKVLAKFNDRPEAWVAVLRDIIPLQGTAYENMTDDELFIALTSYAKFKFKRNAEGNFNGTTILRDAIVNRNGPIRNQDGTVFNTNALVNSGRPVTYYDFERDPRREQGKEFLSRFSEAEFEGLMDLMDKSITDDGLFNRLISPAMEQKVVFRLIDRWLNDERWLNKRVNGEFVNKRKGRWGYRTRWWARQKLVDEAIMDMRDAFTHKFITDQLETDSTDRITITHRVRGANVPFTVNNIKLTPDSRRVIPIFSMFSHNKFQTAGQDPVWALTGGSQHYFPGMEMRLTEIYPFYERNRWLYLFLAVTDDPEFQIEFAWNAKEDWIKDRCYARVLNRKSRAHFIRAIGAMEGTDKDWEEEWMERAGVKDVVVEKDFGYRLKNLHVRDITAQKAEDFTDEDLVNMRKLTMTVASKVPGGGIVSGVLGSVFGKGGDEWKYRLLGLTPGGVIGGILGVGAALTPIGAVTGIVGGAIVLSVGGSMFLAADQGQDDEGDEIVIYNRTWQNKIRYALWQQWYLGKPFSMTAARLHGCKPEILLANSSEHDDAVPIKDFAEMFKGAKDLYQEAGIGKGGH